MFVCVLFYSRQDLCKSKDVCQTLGEFDNVKINVNNSDFKRIQKIIGMARLGQVCVSSLNCAIIEDSGINTAYTIAHEIGHL